ncbi:hypothetical protein [Arthrobacter sp. H35-D1]|uniref:hypothetical protein n=1 Tax=Arthrobacter sp. H35-D1 TaxID=3046202 RepID=UPI0024BA50D6|nr:hypothetical protein [Arthrobacter sp. H35-D1]MDJ0312182.1 hypothetical protein [Arthrobacter sp. H35-D1]
MTTRRPLPDHAPEHESGSSPVHAVDSSAGIGGYRLAQTDPLDRAPRKILELWADNGLTGIRIEGSSWEELAILRELVRLRVNDGQPVPRIAGGGPVLVDTVPASDREYWIGDRRSLRAALETVLAHGVGWVGMRLRGPDWVRPLIEAAHAAGLRVAYRGPWEGTAHLAPGDHLPAAADVLGGLGQAPLQLLHRWAQEPEKGEDRLAWARSAGLTVGSGLMALRRSVFLREALDAPFLEELEPILPHSAHLREMKRPGGYLAGKRLLRQHTGLAEPSRSDGSLAEDGWGRLLSALGSVPEPLVPATRTPQLTSLPGYAWHEECALLKHAGVPDPGSRGAGLLTGPFAAPVDTVDTEIQ